MGLAKERELTPPTPVELANARAVVANLEIAMTNAGNCSPERKAWFMGCRCGLAFALGLPEGARKLQEMIAAQAAEGVINPFEGSKALDQQRRAT